MQARWRFLGIAAAVAGAATGGYLLGKMPGNGTSPDSRNELPEFQAQPRAGQPSATASAPNTTQNQASDCLLLRDGQAMARGPCNISETATRLVLNTSSGRMVISEGGEDDISFEATLTASDGSHESVGEVYRVAENWTGEGPIQPVRISGATYAECYRNERWQICATIRNRVRADRVGHWIPLG